MYSTYLFIQLYIARVGTGSGRNVADPAKNIRIRNPDTSSVRYGTLPESPDPLPEEGEEAASSLVANNPGQVVERLGPVLGH